MSNIQLYKDYYICGCISLSNQYDKNNIILINSCKEIDDFLGNFTKNYHPDIIRKICRSHVDQIANNYSILCDKLLSHNLLKKGILNKNF